MEDMHEDDECITYMAQYIGTLETKVHRLETKFDAITTWLNSKFGDDSSFPKDLSLAEHDLKDKSNTDIKIKLEPIDIDRLEEGSIDHANTSSCSNPFGNVAMATSTSSSRQGVPSSEGNSRKKKNRKRRRNRGGRCRDNDRIDELSMEESDSDHQDDDDEEDEKPEVDELLANLPPTKYATRSITQNGGQVVIIRQCRYCEAKFDTIRKLIDHTSREHPVARTVKSVWQCPECTLALLSAKRLIKHLSTVHRTEVSRTDVKGMHKKIPPAEREVVCRRCLVGCRPGR